MHLIKISFSIALLLFVSSCKEVQDPVFKRIHKVEIKNLNLDNIELATIAEFYNPNGVSLNIDKWDIQLIANGINMGKVELQIPSTIPSKQDFKLPMTISFPPKKLLEKKGGILSGILSSVLDRKLELEYKGYIIVEILNVKVKIPVEEYQELELKL